MNMIQRTLDKKQIGSTPKKKKLVKIVPIVILVLFALIVLWRIVGKDESQTAANSSSQKVAGASAKTDINKSFLISIPDAKGKEIGKLRFEITSAEKRNEILVKGQKATAVEGRQFLIIDMKIENNIDNSVDVNSRNYVRLSVNGNEEEWLAPDIHNDPVEVQAISTKLTRVGFPINDSDSLLMLQIGDIQSDKEKILLEF